MIRPQGKAKKIAFKILGEPANMKHSKNAVSPKINKLLIFQDTSRVR